MKIALCLPIFFALGCSGPDELLVAHKEPGTKTCTVPLKAPQYEDMDTTIAFDDHNCTRGPSHWEAGP